MTALSVVGSVLSGVARPSLGHGVGFSLPAFLAAMDDGFSFDFTKTDRFFQENTGPTLADDVGEAIGLALESRKWSGRTLAQELAQQDELVTNGTFDTDLTGWADTSTGTGTSAWESPSRLKVISVDSSNIGQATQGFATEIGKTYYLSVGAIVFATAARILIGTTSTGFQIATLAISAATTVYYFVATSTTTYLTLRAGNGSSTGNVAFDNISVKEIPGKHATQATGSLKPTRQVFYGYSDDQPELLVNGSFDADANWNKGPGWTISGGVATKTAGSASSLSSTSMVAEIGKTYRITCSVTRTAGIFTFGFAGGGGSSPSITATGTYTFDITATVAREFIAYGNDVSAGTVDSISVKEVPASRITTAAKGDGSDDNLLTTYTANIVAGGAELSSAWTAGTGWVASGNGGTHTAGGGNGYLSSSSFTAAVPGTVYKLTYTVSGASGSGQYQPDIGGAVGAARSTDGTFTDYIKAVTATPLLIFCQSARGITVSNVSVKEVTNQDNFIVAYVNVPTTISSTQLFAGASDGASGNRFFVGFNTDGTFGAGIGANSVGVIKDTTDWRGKSAVFGVSFDGSTVRLFANDQIVYEAAQSGVPSSSTAVRIAGQNSGGTAGNFFSGQIADLLAGREFLTLERYLQIRNALINQ